METFKVRAGGRVKEHHRHEKQGAVCEREVFFKYTMMLENRYTFPNLVPAVEERCGQRAPAMA